jgi:hypothetical protein
MKTLDPFLNRRTGDERKQALELAALAAEHRQQALDNGTHFPRVKMLPALCKLHRVHHLEYFACKAKGGPKPRGIRPAGFGTNVARWNRGKNPGKTPR